MDIVDEAHNAGVDLGTTNEDKSELPAQSTQVTVSAPVSITKPSFTEEQADLVKQLALLNHFLTSTKPMPQVLVFLLPSYFLYVKTNANP